MAMDLIDRMLAINPISIEFRAMKAAAHFIDNDIEAMNALMEEVLEYNPVAADMYRIVGRLASRHYRFSEGASFQRKALDLNEADHAARALYSLDLLRLGHEDIARGELERAFDDNPFNVTAFNMLELMDTLDTFETIERGDFILKLPVEESPVMANVALDLLDEAITKYEEKYSIVLDTPILIEMFDNHDDFMVRSVGLPGNVGHLGICFGKLVTMDAPSVRPRGSANWRSVLWHEFMHVITLQKNE